MSAVLAPAREDTYQSEFSSLEAHSDTDRNGVALRLVTPWQGIPRVSSRTLPGEALALRAALFVLACLVAIFLGMLLGVGLGPEMAMPTDYLTHVVTPGDTLWSLAATNAAGHPIDEVLAQIMSANSVDANSVLTPGQELLIPVF